MKVLITGHKGYIGSRLFKKCEELGYEVIGLDLKEKRDINYISKYFEYSSFKPDVIFHMAAIPAVQYSVEHPAETCYHNVLGTSNILQFAKNNGVKRVVFSSSSAIYGNENFPVSPYGLHKLQSELECKLYSNLYGLDTVCLRYFNVYSEDQLPTNSYPTVISAWMQRIREGKELIVYGDGSHSRDYIHLDDIIACNLFAAKFEGSFKGSCYDVGTGLNYSLNYIKNFILSRHNVTFKHLEPRSSDALFSRANIDPLLTLGWKSQMTFNNGLKGCF
jgi:nucleoside-diphosphate-sugar epimerase